MVDCLYSIDLWRRVLRCYHCYQCWYPESFVKHLACVLKQISSLISFRQKFMIGRLVIIRFLWLFFALVFCIWGWRIFRQNIGLRWQLWKLHLYYLWERLLLDNQIYDGLNLLKLQYSKMGLKCNFQDLCLHSSFCLRYQYTRTFLFYSSLKTVCLLCLSHFFFFILVLIFVGVFALLHS